ncbi:MAG TPA: hypothetical protein VNE58_14885 [Casimicrobiaceae bacterium]|nr:hypothetical protein [Casimicrobiaceae bacterium]
MARRAEASSDRRREARKLDKPRFDIDRAWLWRGGLAIALVAFIVIVAKVSLMAFSSGNQRLERHERGSEAAPAAQRSVPARAR